MSKKKLFEFFVRNQATFGSDLAIEILQKLNKNQIVDQDCKPFDSSFESTNIADKAIEMARRIGASFTYDERQGEFQKVGVLVLDMLSESVIKKSKLIKTMNKESFAKARILFKITAQENEETFVDFLLSVFLIVASMYLATSIKNKEM